MIEVGDTVEWTMYGQTHTGTVDDIVETEGIFIRQGDVHIYDEHGWHSIVNINLLRKV